MIGNGGRGGTYLSGVLFVVETEAADCGDVGGGERREEFMDVLFWGKYVLGLEVMCSGGVGVGFGSFDAIN